MNPPLATYEDSTLIKLTLRGQAECFAALMDRHSVAVKRRIASLVRNPADKDDLFQEVTLKVWLHLSTFRSESSFRTWVTRVATNEALQSYRQQQRRPLCRPLADHDVITSPAEPADSSLAREEAVQAVRIAIAGLPEKYRQVIILRDLEQRTSREAAQLLHSSIEAVKARLFRARLLLLVALQQSKSRGSMARKARKAQVGTVTPEGSYRNLRPVDGRLALDLAN
jgi:RNA polymerase sigma-70 factor (ECF subfamily)